MGVCVGLEKGIAVPFWQKGIAVPFWRQKSAEEADWTPGHGVDSSDAINQGIECENRGDIDGARAAYLRADNLDDPFAALRLGRLLERSGDSAGALSAYRRAEQRGETAAALYIGSHLVNGGDLDGAIAAYRRADEQGEPDRGVESRRAPGKTWRSSGGRGGLPAR